ncbi:MAG: CdaR family protein, partial [Eubacteriales bacterium]|nr:CdaR family protein [Eubacteriales bacterium]
MKNKSLFNRLLENKKLMIILSLLLALMFWVITSDNMTKTINNVPVECSLSEGVDSELVVFPKSIDNVSVVVAGKRVLLQSLNPEDIDAYVDLSEVNSPITANFDIQVKNRNSGYEIESIEPESIRLVIDREVTKSVEVFSDFDYSPEGYYVDNNLPQTIDISGPEGIVDRIKCAYVSGNVSSYNAQTVTNSFDIKLYDTENIGNATDVNIISTDYLTINKKIEVTFRFLKLAENVPFTA